MAGLVAEPDDQHRALAAAAADWLLPGGENPYSFPESTDRPQLAKTLEVFSPGLLAGLSTVPDRFNTESLRKRIGSEVRDMIGFTGDAEGNVHARRIAYSLRSRLHSTVAFGHLYEALGAEHPLIWGSELEFTEIRRDFGARAWAQSYKTGKFKAGQGLLDEGPERVEEARSYVLARELCLEFTGEEDPSDEAVASARPHVLDPRAFIRAVSSLRTFDRGAVEAFMTASVPQFADGAL